VGGDDPIRVHLRSSAVEIPCLLTFFRVRVPGRIGELPAMPPGSDVSAYGVNPEDVRGNLHRGAEQGGDCLASLTLNRGFGPVVMAGLDPAIHVFLCSRITRRGWPAFAGHECVREDALSARCKSVPGLVAAQKSKVTASQRCGVESNRR
jgi:hypothetical protein